ncbi:MAG: lipopolysaccharide heptosyltransferase II [Fusobacteriota bacterium]
MKILIIHTAFIGDIVLSTPLIDLLKFKYQKSKIDYITTPSGAAILKNNPNLNKIISYDKKGKNKGIQELIKLIRRIKKEKYDIAIIPHRYLRSTLIAFFSGIKERVGYSNSGGKIFLTKKINYEKESHEVKRLLNLIQNKEISMSDANLKLYPGKKEREEIDKLWEKNNLDNYKIITIAPGSKWLTKRWPLNYYNELIKKISKDKRYKILLIGGRDEKDLNIRETSTTLNLIGKTTLLEVAEILKRSNLLIGNDSSPLHIASAFGIEIIAIFGATTKGLGFYPWSKKGNVIEKKDLECRPCGLHGGDKCPENHFKCMLEIEPEEVYNKVLKILK